MSKRDIGQEILEGIREVKAHKAGKKTLRTHTLKAASAAADYSRETEIVAICFCRS